MTDIDEYWMNVAEQAANHSECLRLKVGAVIVSKYGHNGTIGCNRHNSACAKDIPGGCGSTHAEANVLRHGNFDGGTIYVTHMPCAACAIAIHAAGIARVVYRHPYRLTEGVDYLVENGIQVTHLPNDDASQSSIETTHFAIKRDS